MTIAQLAVAADITPNIAGNAIRSMVDGGQAKPLSPASKGHPAVYAVTDKEPSTAGPIANLRSRPRDPVHLNGAGRIALEEAWPVI